MEKRIATPWESPVFGYVPERHRDWYLKNSGTVWKEKDKCWKVSGDIIEQRPYYSVKYKETNTSPLTQAHLFEERMIATREKIIEIMESISTNYAIGHEHIFDLMKDKKTSMKYRIDGQEFIKEISL